MASSDNIPLVSCMFQRIITFPVDAYWKYPMYYQRHLPNQFHFCEYWCNILPRESQYEMAFESGCEHGAPTLLKNILFTLLDLCVSSLRRGHANLLCIAQILTDDPLRSSANTFEKHVLDKSCQTSGSPWVLLLASSLLLSIIIIIITITIITTLTIVITT